MTCGEDEGTRQEGWRRRDVALRRRLEAESAPVVLRAAIEAFGLDALLTVVAQYMETKCIEQAVAYPGAAERWRVEASLLRAQLQRMRCGWPRVI